MTLYQHECERERGEMEREGGVRERVYERYGERDGERERGSDRERGEGGGVR